MMYPPLPRCATRSCRDVFRDTKVLGLSLVQNWVVGPVLMFALAVIFLPDKPEYMVGPDHDRPCPLHRHGDRLERARQGLDRICRRSRRLQLRSSRCLFYSVYAWFFITVLPPLFGLSGSAVRSPSARSRKASSSIWESPACWHAYTRAIMLRFVSKDWYHGAFMSEDRADHSCGAAFHHRHHVQLQGRNRS